MADRAAGLARWLGAHRATPYALVTLAALIVTRAFWTPGSYVVAFDTYAYSGAHLEVTERAVRDLRVPQVNDMIFGGVPQLGNPQAGVWYPAHLLTLLLETNRAMGVIVALHVVVLGVGLVALASRLGADRLQATVAGVVGVSSGAVLLKAVQFEQILSLAWAPLLLVAIHATLNADRPSSPMAALAATTAAVLLAGHPQLAFETIVLASAATIGFAFDQGRWRRLPHLAAGVLLGALIAAPQLVAGLAAASDGAVGIGRSLDDLSAPESSVSPQFAVRAMLGTVQSIRSDFFAGNVENIGYVGVTALLLAVVGLVRSVSARDSRPWAISLGAFAAIALLLSLGPRTVVFRAAYRVVPGFDLARVSSRWIVMAVIVIALFAGIGARPVAERARRGRAGGALAASVAVVLVVATGPFDLESGRTLLLWGAVAMSVVALLAAAALLGSRLARVAAGGIVVVLVLEMALMTRNSMPQLLRTDTPFTAYTNEATEWLVGRDGYTIALTGEVDGAGQMVPGLRPNANALAPIPSIDGYDGGVQVTERWVAALRRLTPDPVPTLALRTNARWPLDPDALARLGVRYVLTDRDPADAVPDWRGPVVLDGSLSVWENPAWVGEAIAFPAAIPIASEEVAADLLRVFGARYASTALVDDPDGALACDRSAAACVALGLPVIEYSPEHVEVRTSLDSPAVVMVTKQALPGWQVEIDGRDADELTVDGLFLGVQVPAGEHVVEWRYRSPLLIPTMLLSIFASLAALCLAARARLGQRTGGAPERSIEP